MTTSSVRIDDVQDPRLDPYRDVRYRRSTRFGSTFVAEGRLVVERLLASGYRTLSVLVQQGREATIATDLAEETELLCVPREVLCELVGFRFHRGMMACAVRPDWPAADALLHPGAGGGDASSAVGSLVAAACGITDPENLGSVLRSAAALGVRDILLGPGTADPLARRVLRVSMAAALKLRFYQSADLADDLRRLISGGAMRVVATSLSPAAMRLDHLRLDQRRTVVLLGNEACGLPVEIQRLATDLVTIPMRLGTDSLNVAVAAGIVLYELTREAAAAHDAQG